MYLTKAFVFSVAMILVLLLAAFATEQSRCVERARRIIQEEFMPTIPANATPVTAQETTPEVPVCTPRRSGRMGWG